MFKTKTKRMTNLIKENSEELIHSINKGFNEISSTLNKISENVVSTFLDEFDKLKGYEEDIQISSIKSQLESQQTQLKTMSKQLKILYPQLKKNYSTFQNALKSLINIPMNGEYYLETFNSASETMGTVTEQLNDCDLHMTNNILESIEEINNQIESLKRECNVCQRLFIKYQKHDKKLKLYREMNYDSSRLNEQMEYTRRIYEDYINSKLLLVSRHSDLQNCMVQNCHCLGYQIIFNYSLMMNSTFDTWKSISESLTIPQTSQIQKSNELSNSQISIYSSIPSQNINNSNNSSYSVNHSNSINEKVIEKSVPNKMQPFLNSIPEKWDDYKNTVTSTVSTQETMNFI